MSDYCSTELERLKKRLFTFLYFYGLALVIASTAITVWLLNRVPPIYLVMFWATFTVTYTLLWIINIEDRKT